VFWVSYAKKSKIKKQKIKNQKYENTKTRWLFGFLSLTE